MKILFGFLVYLILTISCSENDSVDNTSDIKGKDVGEGGCISIKDCSDKETKDFVCIQEECKSIGDADKALHIVFYPKYISSVVSDISYFKYYYLYPLDISGNAISCDKLLSDYNFESRTDLNIIQFYEKQARISSTGSEMYTLPLPSLKDSIIFFIFYSENGSDVAIGCADKIDTTSNNSVGISRANQTNQTPVWGNFDVIIFAFLYY